MGIERRVFSLRMDNEERAVFDAIQAKFWPFTRTFKDAVMLAGRMLLRFIDRDMLEEIVQTCQRLQCSTPDSQLRLHFPPAVGVSFFPKIHREISE